MLGAYIVSIIGDWIFRLAIPVLIFELTGSPLWMSVGYAAAFVPHIIVSPFGGVIGDFFKRQKVLYIGDFISGFLCLFLVIYIFLDGQNVLLIILLLFFLSSVEACYYPAFQGFIPNLVAAEGLARANSLFSMSNSIFQVIGPVLSGGIIALFGIYSIIALNAISFFISALALFLIVPLFKEKKTQQKFNLSQIKKNAIDGFRIAMSQPVLKWSTVLFAIEVFAGQIVVGNLIYFLTQNIGLSIKNAGIVIGLTGFGAVLGAMLAPYFIKRALAGRIMLACIGLCIPATAMLLFASNTTFGVVMFIIGRSLISLAEATIIVTMFTFRQTVLPANYLSRSVAIVRAITWIPIPIAAVAGGWILSASGGNMNAVIVVSLISIVICFMLGFFTPFIKKESHRPIKTIASG